MENSPTPLAWRIKPVRSPGGSLDGFARPLTRNVPVASRGNFAPLPRPNLARRRQYTGRQVAKSYSALPAPTFLVPATPIEQPMAKMSDNPISEVHLKQAPKSKLPALARYAIVVVILSVTGALAINTWQTNKYVQKVAAQPQTTMNTPSDDGQSTTTGAVVPAETPVTPKAVKAYTVAPNLPKTISISKLGVRARVLQMGVLANGEMATPSNTNDTGWYMGSVRPGEKGASIINGHVSGLTRGGVFLGLKKLGVGDKITITKGDGAVLTYEVRATEAIAADQLNMSKLFSVYEDKDEGLNLITCAGTYNRSTKSFNKRTIVYAVRSS
ncbi:sortase [Candidatus Saccharibacteria bacterium]|nr:sortase [Candidatus Saccharibacteria bacterium]